MIGSVDVVFIININVMFIGDEGVVCCIFLVLYVQIVQYGVMIGSGIVVFVIIYFMFYCVVYVIYYVGCYCFDVCIYCCVVQGYIVLVINVE